MPSYTDALKSAWTRAQAQDASLLAAGIAFYAFLSFVPLLIAGVLSYGVIAQPETVATHAQTLVSTLPASAGALMVDQLEAITKDRTEAEDLGLILAIIAALFSARVAAGSVITAFNVAFGAQEGRGLVKANVLALCITIGALGAMGLVAATISMTTFVIPEGAGSAGTYLVIAIAGTAGAMLAYRIVPNVDDVSLSEAVRGALPFGISWMLASIGFGFYVSNFGSYNATYGSLGAIVVLLTWLFLSAYLLLLGAFIAAETRRTPN